MAVKNNAQEIREAIAAADDALAHLSDAEKYLESAGGWGLADMVGGGFLVTMMKRSKMKDAQTELERARIAVRRFAQELRDVDAIVDVDLETEGFLDFADYFFDGFLADVMVQSKINKAAKQVRHAIENVRAIREKLLYI